MHFSIPDTQEFIDTTGNSYLGYNVHINGLFHCTVRYKQLLHLHEHLTKEMNLSLPSFPPKKLFPLTANQQEERRLSLEKYIQTIGQNANLNNCTLLNSFLLNAQQETANKMAVVESLDVYLHNSQRVTLRVSTAENATRVLRKFCRHLGLREDFDRYFALFVIIENESNANILRRLQDFESPVLTLVNINCPAVKIVVGKSYWEVENDIKLMQNPISLNLLYQQAIAEVARGWILIPPELEHHLKDLTASGKKKEYLELIRSCKYYGFTHFAPCTCDYPQANTKVLVAIGRNELNIRMLLENNEEHEAVFKVTRMRCWRITTLHNGLDRSDDRADPSEYSLELSFEYLVARNQLQWITIASEQAILMSVSLQGMIDEFLVKDREEKRSVEFGKSWSYVMRDGVSRITIGEGGEEDGGVRGPQVEGIKCEGGRWGRKESCDIMENNAFHVIGDDDL